MKRTFLKLSRLGALALIAVLGIGLFSACKSNDEGDANSLFYGEWKCTDFRYNQEGHLKLLFDSNYRVLAENTTEAASLFDGVINNHYEIRHDTILYIELETPYYLEFIIRNNSYNKMELFYTGGITTEASAPSGEYEFIRF